MAEPKKAKPKRRVRPLYHSAKISDYRFKKVLWHFVRDYTAAETAKGTGLSVNSVHAIFRKLRVYFYEVGLFQDFYEGRDPMAVETRMPDFEYDLIDYHLKRYGEKHGFKSPSAEPHYHFAESHWRYDFEIMRRERNSDAVYDMMMAHLIEIIRICGAVGSKPTNQQVGLHTVLKQIDQRIAWLERNSSRFGADYLRDMLLEAREIR